MSEKLNQQLEQQDLEAMADQLLGAIVKTPFWRQGRRP